MNDRQRFQGRANRPSGGRSNGQQGGQGGQQGGRSGGNRQRNHNGRGGGGGGGGNNRGNNGQRREEIVAAPLVDGIAEGLLWIPDNDRGDGALRDSAHPLRPARGNIIVPRGLIRELNLRPGLMLKGIPSGKSLNKVDTVEGKTIDEYGSTTPLYDATAMDPEPVLKLEHDPAELTTRIIDILTPVGFGQRGLIVAPPRSGKTILLQNMAKGIHHNYPNVELVLLLIDERPEEVTDMRRNIPGTVYASSNDNTIDKHLDLAQLVIERCKRKVEFGQNIVVLMDSLTRVGRAFNAGGPSGGRTMSGGLDNRALEIPKKLFGAARKIENGGSLTILATCLIDTGSRMDQVIFEEFKGTGNMELTLDRNLANQRIYPAIDIAASGTRKEEKLLDAKALASARGIRRHLMNMPPAGAIKSLCDALAKHKSNQSLFDTMKF
jgi:transcription termination factor Rho